MGQYNGSHHISVAGVSNDVRKEAAYRDLGLEVVTMVSSDWSDLDGFAARLVAARDRACARAGPRRWTVDHPTWWTPTWTVAQRRVLTDRQRKRYLRYRRAAPPG